MVLIRDVISDSTVALMPSADSAPRVEKSVANGSAHIVVRKAGCMNPHVGLADGGSEVVGSEVGGAEVSAGFGAGFVGSEVVGETEGDVVGSEVVGETDGDVVGSEVVGETEGDVVGSEVVGETEGDMVWSEVVGEIEGEVVRSEVVSDTVSDTVGDWLHPTLKRQPADRLRLPSQLLALLPLTQKSVGKLSI